VGIVGVCASGKSVLARRLTRAGCDAHEIGQEHSYVPDMWNRIHPPDVLIYLVASYDAVQRRRPNSLMTEELHGEMTQRLQHAREHADLIVYTDGLTEADVLQRVLSYLTHK
jgi:hypothetical protein